MSHNSNCYYCDRPFVEIVSIIQSFEQYHDLLKRKVVCHNECARKSHCWICHDTVKSEDFQLEKKSKHPACDPDVKCFHCHKLLTEEDDISYCKILEKGMLRHRKCIGLNKCKAKFYTPLGVRTCNSPTIEFSQLLPSLWNFKNHKYFSQEIKNAIFAFLLMWRFQKVENIHKLNKDVLYKIIQEIANNGTVIMWKTFNYHSLGTVCTKESCKRQNIYF